jgi:hypothetical protein
VPEEIGVEENIGDIAGDIAAHAGTRCQFARETAQRVDTVTR